MLSKYILLRLQLWYFEIEHYLIYQFKITDKIIIKKLLQLEMSENARSHILWN